MQDHVTASNAAKNKGLNLKEATEIFLSSGNLEDKETVLALQAFQEGAFWACWLVHREFCQDHPNIFKRICEILEEHAKTSAFFKKFIVEQANQVH